MILKWEVDTLLQSMTKLEFENIRRKVLQKEKDGERFYQDEENIYKNKTTQVDTENLGEGEKTMIQDILDLMKDNSRKELRGFNKIDHVHLPNGQGR